MVNSMTRAFEVLWELAKRFLNCPRGSENVPREETDNQELKKKFFYLASLGLICCMQASL